MILICFLCMFVSRTIPVQFGTVSDEPAQVCTGLSHRPSSYSVSSRARLTAFMRFRDRGASSEGTSTSDAVILVVEYAHCLPWVADAPAIEMPSVESRAHELVKEVLLGPSRSRQKADAMYQESQC